MAAMTHMAVGLAAKRIAPKTPVILLILAAYVIDMIWGVFYYFGIESMADGTTTNPWSHGLFMSLVWSALVGGIVFWVSHKNRRAGWIAGLLVFSHWVIDFISHPMLFAFLNDTGLSLLFDGSPTVGLGLWRTELGMNIGEYGMLVAGVIIYALTLWKIRREKKAVELENRRE
ncbi:hypothetical protein ANAEL_02452 [Anaerolineales bacterium]|nr:hypothetical protein ANAEL_02452 [Anaerolineales bacterium]